METEKFNEKMFRECEVKFKLTSTIPKEMQDKRCSVCNTVCICMRLDKSPKEGFKSSSHDMFLFYGCPNCKTIYYEKNDLKFFSGEKCSLEDYFIKNLGIL